MKRYISLLMGLLAFIPISAQQSDYYYYYKGNRIDLEVDSTRLYVVSEGELQPQTGTYVRSISYDVKSSTKSPMSSNIIPLKTRHTLSTTTEVYFSSLEIPDGLNPSQYSTLVEEVKAKDNVWQVLPSFNYNGYPINATNKFHVKLKTADDLSKLQQLATEYGIEIVGNDKYIPLWYTLSCNAASAIHAIEAANIFYTSGMFACSEPEMYGYVVSNTSDPLYEQQWNLKNTGLDDAMEGIDINVEEAWNITKGDSVVVAVFDEPICVWHEDLSANIYTSSYDISTGQGSVFNPETNTNHGTACASIIAAVQDNEIGMSGIAPESKIMPVSFSGSEVSPEQIKAGFIEASEEADIISCSWTYLGSRQGLIDEGINYALNNGRGGKGCVVVFSSGNDEDGGNYYYDEEGNYYCEDETLGDEIGYPANCNPRILTVGGITPRGRRTLKGQLANGRLVFWSSNYGQELDVVAPSVEIYTANYPNGSTPSSTYYYGNFNGTSAACPHASAVAALILSAHPDLTGDQVVSIIEYSAKKIRPDLYTYQVDSLRPHGTWNEEMGYGLIDAGAAVQIADKATRTTYLRDTVVTDTKHIIDYDVEIENAVISDEGMVEIDKEHNVLIKKSFLVKKEGIFRVFETPLSNDN